MMITINNKNIKTIEDKSQIQINYDEQKNKKESLLSSNDFYQNNKKLTNEIVQDLKNNLITNKERTKSKELDKRYDKFGNIISHCGKQKVSFIDKISKNNFIEVIKVDNYKEYNKMEEITPSNRNGCCILI